jgi:hypothetical protein
MTLHMKPLSFSISIGTSCRYLGFDFTFLVRTRCRQSITQGSGACIVVSRLTCGHISKRAHVTRNSSHGGHSAWRTLGRITGKIVSNPEAVHQTGGRSTIGLRPGTNTCTTEERSWRGVQSSAVDILSSENGGLCYLKAERDGGSSRSVRLRFVRKKHRDPRR